MPYKDPEKAREQRRRYYEANRETILERQRDYYEANRERVVARIGAWKKANPEKVRVSARRHRIAHAEERAEYGRQWRKNNPEKAREKDARYNGNPGRMMRWTHGPDIHEYWAERFAAQEGRCCYCARPLPEDRKGVHVDHDHTCTCGAERSCSYCRRGLACKACNQLIGLADEDWDRLERIAASGRRLQAEARERISGKPVQEELPLNVSPIRREATS